MIEQINLNKLINIFDDAGILAIIGLFVIITTADIILGIYCHKYITNNYSSSELRKGLLWHSSEFFLIILLAGLSFFVDKLLVNVPFYLVSAGLSFGNLTSVLGHYVNITKHEYIYEIPIIGSFVKDEHQGGRENDKMDSK